MTVESVFVYIFLPGLVGLGLAILFIYFEKRKIEPEGGLAFVYPAELELKWREDMDNAILRYNESIKRIQAQHLEELAASTLPEEWEEKKKIIDAEYNEAVRIWGEKIRGKSYSEYLSSLVETEESSNGEGNDNT